jgi:Holliday junction DNA helicase RuvA
MIGKLKGMVDSIEEDHLILDVGGVGYQVFTSPRLLQSAGEGELLTLFIETHVREDHIHLYGFSSASERAACRVLLTVQGVGMKMALAILNALSPAALAQAIAAKDRSALTQISGVGPKLADRILTEMKDKAIKLLAGSASDVAAFAPATPAPAKTTKAKSRKTADASPEAAPAPSAALLEEATSALTHLGYGRSEAFAAVAQTARELPAADLQSLIPASLQKLAKSA